MNILIADDQELSRTGLRFGLQADARIETILEAENGQEAIRLIDELSEIEKGLPDLVLMDISMPTMDGILATRDLKARYPQLKIIMLTSSYADDEVFSAMSAGADGFCLKTVKLAHLMQIMDVVATGGVWLEPSVAECLIRGMPQESVPAEQSAAQEKPSSEPSSKTTDKMSVANTRLQALTQSSLTSREWDVLKLIAEGKSNKEIAQTLVVTIHTVKIHVSSIIQKLAVSDRTQAAIKALQEGLVPAPSSKN